MNNDQYPSLAFAFNTENFVPFNSGTANYKNKNGIKKERQTINYDNDNAFVTNEIYIIYYDEIGAIIS